MNVSVKENYPVVYLFDGEDRFSYVTLMIQQLIENGIVPKMIIVGIANTDRTRDLTPSHVDNASYVDKTFGWNTERIKSSGGGENFVTFIEKELFPHIDSLYPTAPYRILIGHSFGGLTAVNILLNHSNLFNSYIAIDPTLWWDNQKTMKQAEKDLAKKTFDGKTLFLAIANVMQPNMDTMQVRKDTTSFSMHIRSNLQFNDALNKNKQNNLHWSSKYYKYDNHGSVPFIAEYDGLRFIFSFYKFSTPYSNEFYTFNIDSALTAHYKNVTKQMGYGILPPEGNVNNYANAFLAKKNFAKAYKLFQMNLDNYPKSFNAYNSMGDYYNETGEKQKAIEYYTKALTISDSPDTKAKLEKLKIGK